MTKISGFFIKYNCSYIYNTISSRYITRLKYETRTRRKSKTIYQCCTGYKQKGNECPIGVTDFSGSYLGTCQTSMMNLFMKIGDV